MMAPSQAILKICLVFELCWLDGGVYRFQQTGQNRAEMSNSRFCGKDSKCHK